MFPLSAAELARLCGGIAKGEPSRQVLRIVIDSRAVQPGDLFLALRGARTDGHQHLADAFQRGARVAMVEADGPPRPAGMTVVVVPHCLRALADLARAARARLQAEVIGITGSVGKTTAKDFLASLLGGGEHQVHAAPASYNSEIGLPLAVLAAPADSRLLVLEYGINAPGEMDALLAIVRPDHAWLTAIAAAHLEGLQDLQLIAREKSLLPGAVSEGGSIWLDSATAEAVAASQPQWCGLSQRLDPLSLCQEGLQGHPGAWRLDHPRFGPLVFRLAARHQVVTALTAAHIAASLGVDDGTLAARLPRLGPPPGRMTVHQFDGRTVLEDCYNANPASMAAALATMQEWPGEDPRWAVLGTMHELGAGSQTAHHALGRQLAESALDTLIAVGEGGAWIAEGLAQMDIAQGPRVLTVPDATGAGDVVVAEMPAQALLLLKASRAARLESIRRRLASAAAAPSTSAVEEVA